MNNTNYCDKTNDVDNDIITKRCTMQLKIVKTYCKSNKRQI